MKTLLCSTLALLVWVWLNLGQTPAVAQEASMPEQSLTPLENLLQPDGTLNLQAGFNGSLDPAGWRMVSEPGQTPRFGRVSNSGEITNGSALKSRAAMPGDEFWDDRFGGQSTGENSPNGQVCAITVSGSDVYVGGEFSIAGGVSANNIAKWNSASNTWSALGSGVSNTLVDCEVRGIAVSGNDVYVGGVFSSAGEVPGTYAIAKWNSASNTWSALGGGTAGGGIDDVAVKEGVIYIGGLFSRVNRVVNPVNPNDRVTVNNIAGWNGDWFALGSGVNVGVSSRVFDVAVSGDNVYVGGGFTTAGGVPANYIAKWDSTTSTWSALGNGLDLGVDAIAVSGDDVYATGTFTRASDVPANYVAKWNGASWSALGSGLDFHCCLGIGSLALSGSDVYVGGSFTMAGGVSAKNIAKWDSTTSTWSALGSGVDSSVYGIAVGVDSVYVGGTFGHAGSKPSYNFGLWHIPPGGNTIYLPLILR